MSITKYSLLVDNNLSTQENRTMTDKTEKPNLKIVNKDTDLTIKQRAFVDEIIKGKLGS